MSKFKVGDRVVPVSKTVWSGNYSSWANGKCKFPFLYVNGIDDEVTDQHNNPVYFCAEQRDDSGDFYAESDLIPYTGKPINHCTENRTILGHACTLPDAIHVKIQTIFNGPATVCVIKYNGEQFKGIAKCNPTDTWDEATGQVVAMERAAIELSKYRIAQAVNSVPTIK